VKILISLEDEALRDKVKLILENHYELILTDSLEQCLDIVKNTDISTFIVDANQNALETIQKLSNHNPSIKIVAIANYNSEEAANKAVDAGATSFLLKPIKADKLLPLCN